MQIDHDPNTRRETIINWVATLVTIAIMLPIGYYLKVHVQPELAAWSRSFFH